MTAPAVTQPGLPDVSGLPLGALLELDDETLAASVRHLGCGKPGERVWQLNGVQPDA